MFDGKRILALIPARGGSKGIKGKNIIPVAGKPLIAWTVEASLKSRYIDDTVITTDSRDIAEVAERFGAEVPFMRPSELADDKAKTVDAVIHALDTLRNAGRVYDVLILLQPTSPARTSDDIDGAIHVFFAKCERGLASVSPVEDSPLLIRSVNSDGEMTPLLDVNSTCRRQDMPEYFRVNGSIYINRVADINPFTSFNDNPTAYIMSREHSVDIDELKDIIIAEYFMKKERGKMTDEQTT